MDTRCSLSTVACALKIVLDSRESTKEQILIQNKVNRCLTKFSRNNVCSLKIFVFRHLCVSVYQRTDLDPEQGQQVSHQVQQKQCLFTEDFCVQASVCVCMCVCCCGCADIAAKINNGGVGLW